MSTQNLLVVDDQRVDRAIATHAATQVGFKVSGAGTIAETRELFETGSHFDYVVLDLSLGAEDGLEVLPLIARFNPTAVVILASGFDGRVMAASQRVASCLGLLVAGVLRKPILPTALQRLLRHAPSNVTPESDPALTIAPDQLRAAIMAGEIQPWFQPKVAIESGHVVGAEALARWVRTDGRQMTTSRFIAVAEQHGIIEALTDTMLDQALLACARWRHNRPDCSVAINISPLLLTDQTITDRVDQMLHKHDVPPGALVLEITENNGIPDTACALEILARFRIRGVNLSIDDFGTGHSSLLSLVRMPFNEMKIDQAFVREAISSRDARKVVRASASLGRELGLNVVAEGVETAAMADLISEAGVHIGQGWLYGRSVPADVFQAELDPAPATAANPSSV